jgi:hypothetical protein
VKRQDVALTRQDVALTRQDVALTRQDVALTRQEDMGLKRQNMVAEYLFFSIQGTTLTEHGQDCHYSFLPDQFLTNRNHQCP